MKPSHLIAALALAGLSAVNADLFAIQRAPDPPGIDPQIGGLDVLPDGRVVVAFHRGEVMIHDPAKGSWHPFAAGLHEPLGLIAESPASILVMQRAELTRLHDESGDGSADFHETVFDDFGMTGNYHEFAFGPARGPDGSLYIALNLASNGAGTRAEIRGEWSDIGDLDRDQMVHDADWRQRAGRAGRMYARAAYRGWVLRIPPDGAPAEPFASGLRSPNGIGFDGRGNLLVTDNEGDWRGTSPLYTIVRDGFYGNPASLVWTNGWDRGDPLKLPVATLQEMRVPETARFPQGDLANSPTQPIAIPDTWGPYAGHVLIGEMNQNRMVRFIPDEVAGFHQGALLPMFDGTGMGRGNHRLAFAPDGTLWVGKTHLSWAGGEGLWMVRPPTAGDVFTATDCKLVKTDDGHALDLRFSQALGPAPNFGEVESYTYHYHRAYGSPKIENRKSAVTVTLSPDRLAARLAFEVREGFVHRVDLSNIRSADGTAIEGKTLYYQATRLP